MSERFYIAEPPTEGHATLRDDEAHHLARVMRGKPGDVVELFDGAGVEYAARVVSVDRRTVELEVLSQTAVDREATRALTLGVAFPKGDRQKWLVEKCVELGVACIVPLATERTVVVPSASNLERLRRSVIEASKQCRRNRLMRIEQPQPWAEFVRRGADEFAVRAVAHPSGQPFGDVRSMWESQAKTVAFAVGPEGGFTDAEVAMASDWTAVSLGPRILRIETAAIALAAAVLLATR